MPDAVHNVAAFRTLADWERGAEPAVIVAVLANSPGHAQAIVKLQRAAIHYATYDVASPNSKARVIDLATFTYGEVQQPFNAT